MLSEYKKVDGVKKMTMSQCNLGNDGYIFSKKFGKSLRIKKLKIMGKKVKKI